MRAPALTLGLLLGCGSSGADCTPVATPGGMIPKDCVHEVPSGASVTTQPDGSTIVTVNGSVVATYPPCPCTRTAG